MRDGLRKLAGGRALIAGALVVAAVVAAVLLSGGEEPAEPGSETAASTEATTEQPPAAVSEGEPDKAKEKPKRPGSGGSAEPEPAEPASGEDDVLGAFGDCVAERGVVIPGLGAAPAGDEPPGGSYGKLREAGAACLDQLPEGLRERAEQSLGALGETPFRDCVEAERSDGRPLIDAVETCRERLSEGEL